MKPHKNQQVKTQTIQQTSKPLKLMLACGVILILIGALAAIFGPTVNSSVVGLIAFVIGLVTYITARVLAWWNHG